MNVLQWSTQIHATALVIARGIPNVEELTRVALFFTQLGTTLATIAAVEGLEQATEGGRESADTVADIVDVGV